MNLNEITNQGFILALFIRDDSQRFLLGSGAYEFKEDQLHFSANSMTNDIVEVQGNDGYMLAGQVRRPTTQVFDGYIGDASVNRAEVENYRRDFFAFFQKNHFYTVIYIFPNGSAIQRRRGFIVDCGEVKELYQLFPEYHIGMNFEDVNYYKYNEDSDGHEIYGKSAIVGLSTDMVGGLVWEDTVVGTQTKSGVNITFNGSFADEFVGLKMYGDTEQAASPTPDSPQEVQTVTGEQTITISDGGLQTQEYTVNLGSVELCKIGDYQDYIYKSGDDWYLHKAINKIIVDGSENWQYPDSGENYTFFQFSRTSFKGKYGDNADFYANDTEVDFAKADKFEQIIASAANMRTKQGIGFAAQGGGWFRISVANAIATTITAFKAWLAENVTTLYYALATPTDTKITDSTLVGQLDAVVSGGSYNGNTIISVSGDLASPLEVQAKCGSGGGVEWDSNGAVWEDGGGGLTTVSVDSIENVYPVWKVVGPTNNPTLENITTGTTISYSGNVASGQTLVVDMLNETAKLNGTSVIGNISGKWLEFAPGNNTISYTASNSTAPDSTIEWQEIVG